MLPNNSPLSPAAADRNVPPESAAPSMSIPTTRGSPHGSTSQVPLGPGGAAAAIPPSVHPFDVPPLADEMNASSIGADTSVDDLLREAEALVGAAASEQAHEIRQARTR